MNDVIGHAGQNVVKDCEIVLYSRELHAQEVV